LDGAPAHGWSVNVAPGHDFTDGFEVIRLPGKDDAVITAVRLVGDKELQLVGAGLLPPDRGFGSFQYASSWPPQPGDPGLFDGRLPKLLPLGTPITPVADDPAGWELVMGLRADQPGRFLREGIEIDYTIDGEEFTAFRPAKLAVCATQDPSPRKCQLPLAN
jgi:hypothetical protein